LEKVKAHRGEPANKGADILAQTAISDPKKGGVLNPRDNLQFWEIALATTSEEGVVPADDSSSDSIRKVRLEGREREYWTSTETGMLGGCGLQGQIMAGECSDYKGKV
jgi:hypothetical protein